MTAILGISALYHDAAAALVVDGEVVAAAQEERFSRVKHDSALPVRAIATCLEKAGLEANQLDYVGFYDKPLLKFDRLLSTWLAHAPRGFLPFARALPLWLQHKLRLTGALRRAVGRGYRKRFLFTGHHQSHAASAFFPSPYDEAAILTVDGVGEWATASLGVGRGNRVELSHELRFPHSLGLLYSAFTVHCGFKVNSGEYKLMGLAPFGEPRFAAAIRERLLDLKPDGSFRMDQAFFNYCTGLTMTSTRFDALFGGPARKPEEPLTQREMDLAASIQVVSEEILLRMVRHLHQLTGMRRLCLAGGVALNCVANSRLLEQGPFDDVWIQPAAGDAGGALGVALLIWHQALGKPRTPSTSDGMNGALLGPAYSNAEIRQVLDRAGAVYQVHGAEVPLLDQVAELLERGKVVGWMQGPMEFGPRALGNRSILGDPRDSRMRSSIGQKIKFREPFRPVAPAVLEDRASEYFELPKPSPYMLLVAQVAAQRLKKLTDEQLALAGLERLKPPRSEIPAVTHVDGSARVQTVDAQRHGRFHRLLVRFDERTGCPMLVNTSFNVRSEPIVCNPEDALRCFLATGMDALVMEDQLLLKADQPSALVERYTGYQATFEPD